ncbi:hypothetical protein EDD36DRAFT_417685 [Exophiala viscosa]|uniref:Transcription factor domain-containing protein n=1 Tax=Exophiala viscosa TaxID=2486360 RepID=A0AAN6IFR6_9EURO|nr:hypothetical protein EDD36DRAFT_417685 [Exophiala viscosa]
MYLIVGATFKLPAYYYPLLAIRSAEYTGQVPARNSCQVVLNNAEVKACAVLRFLSAPEDSMPSTSRRTTMFSLPKSELQSRPVILRPELPTRVRLGAIEASLVEIKQLVQYQTQTAASSLTSTPYETSTTDPQRRQAPHEAVHLGPETPTTAQRQITATSSESDFSRLFAAHVQVAPIKEVRHLKTLIAGNIDKVKVDNILEELSAIGIASDGLGVLLFEGFKQMSSGQPFVHWDLNRLRQHHTLLLATCILGGVLTLSSLRGSNLHTSLYLLVKDHLGKSMLNTPLELATIHAMLIFSTWNMGPGAHVRYIDSSLLSGSTITHLMLTSGCPGLDLTNNFEESDMRNRTETWVGAGRPLVVESGSIESFLNMLPHHSLGDSYRDMAAELHLYVMLYKGIVKSSVQVKDTLEEIDIWIDKYNTARRPALSFAESAVTVMLVRRELKRLTSQPRAGSSYDSLDDRQTQIKKYVEVLIHHSRRILELMITLCLRTAFVRPTYDSLLGAYASVTLVEYAVHLPDIQATFALMEKALLQGQRAQSNVLVLQWATNMMRKKLLDAMPQRNLQVTEEDLPEPSTDWVSYSLVESVFPTDEVRAFLPMG